MGSRLILKLCMLTLALFLMTPVLAPEMRAAASTNTYNYTISAPVIPEDNTCVPPAGEPVYLNGSVHIVAKMTANSQGGYQMDTFQNYQGVTGVGLITGVNYQDNDIRQTSLFANPPFPYQGTMSVFTNLVSQGNLYNQTLRADYEVTVDAMGVPVLILKNVEIECHG